MKNLFNSVKMTKEKKNLFDLSHDVKLSCKMGNLVPIMLLECVPGDVHTISCESLIRFAPLTTPVMHRFDVTMHYFFVPNRLVWKNWEKFITNTPNEETGLLPAFPTLTMIADNSNHPVGSLADYLGIPINLNNEPNDEQVSAIPFAAYQCIYNEYYRDQNLIAPINYQLQDGNNGDGSGAESVLFELRRRAWEHDYFTACLPWAQKGQAVDIPLGDVVLSPDWQNHPQKLVDFFGQQHPNSDVRTQAQGNLSVQQGATNYASWLDPNGSLKTQPTTINDLRRAFRLQEWLEKAARGGSRYIEWLKVMFGVQSSDKRLQRPEYITGTKSPVIISEVLNSNAQPAGQGEPNYPLGQMGGHAVSVTNGQYGKYYVEEHGYIIGIMSVMPKTGYYQGLNRTFSKGAHPTDFYFPTFANIGEQEVYGREIYAYSDENNSVFGYIPRYAEYRFQENRVCGQFRTTLDKWQFCRKFANAPYLNELFVQCDPGDRIFAVDDPENENLYCQVYNKVMSLRPMPKYGTPTF